jgi:hypothetical protein
MFGGDIGTSAGAVIHEDGRTAQFAGEGFAEGTRQKIAGATGREANHEPNGPPGWPGSAGLRGSRPGCGGQREGRGHKASSADHGFLPVSRD